MNTIWQPNELYHHGILGMKWGIRRYQNADGSYTSAGRKRYALDLDVNDTSRRNVAKIRTGEARRRLDVAKNNKNKKNNNYRIADLRSRLRSAKRNEKKQKLIDKGAKLAAKGQTIQGNNLKRGAITLAAFAGLKAANHIITKGTENLQRDGKLHAGHVAAGRKFLAGAGLAYMATTLVSDIHYVRNNKALRAYNDARWLGETSIKRVGSSEYADRKAALKKSK